MIAGPVRDAALAPALLAAWLVTTSPCARAAEPAAAPDLRFMRVHVPRDALGDVPLGDERYVPLPRAAFEAALDRAAGGETAAAAPAGRPQADAARYEVRIGPECRLEGRVTFDVGAAAAARGELPLGGLAVSRCTARTATGVGDVVVFCRADGTRAIVPAGAGEYAADWIGPAATPTADGLRYVLPLLPAMRSSVRLELPTAARPLVVNQPLPAVRDGSAWMIQTSLRDAVEFLVADEERRSVGLSNWTTIDIAGRELAVETAVVPSAVWGDEPVIVEKDAALVVTAVVVGDAEEVGVAWSEAADGRSIACRLPPTARGGRTPLVIRAVGPLPDGTVRPLPALRPRSMDWSGGGVLLRVDPALALAAIDLEQCLAVTAEAASAWPLPPASRRRPAEGAADQVLPARIYLEQQTPAAQIRVAVAPRTPQLDVERVTIVEFAPAVVTGVATCDIGVERGEAFDLEGLIAAGWFIDAVDLVGWSQPVGWAEPGAAADARPPEPLEWKVVRGGRGDVLRVGLTSAITPDRRLRLRISGHRAGVAAGGAFSAAEIDMVQLPATAAGPAAIGFKTSAEQAVELDGGATGAIVPRLSGLVDDAGVRSWAPAGPDAAAWQVRVVQRRPPLDVQTQVRLTARDDRLSQSFTFECRPDTSDLEGLVVRFSEPLDDQVEWSLLAPAAGGIVARRIESAEESWLVEFTPPISEAVTIRAARTVPFTAAVPVPLAWVEGAARQIGEVIVRDAGRRRPRLVNRRLAELPPRAGDGDRWPTLIGAFSFGGDRDAAEPPAAELLPGTSADDDARAWAWRETVSCWCHASGRTEFETAFDIESQGRPSLVVGLPPGRQLQRVEIDGTPVAVAPRDNVAAVPIDLPAGRASLRLVVRTVAVNDAAHAWWRVEPAGVVVDLPVLDRLYRFHVPPGLEIAMASPALRDVGADERGALERLFGMVEAAASAPVSSRPYEPSGQPGEAFRERDFVPAAGRGEGVVVVVQRRWLGVAAVAVGILVASGVLVVARRRPWLIPVVCGAAGVAALWAPPPADGIARAAWWATILATGFVVGRRLLRRAAVNAGVLVACFAGVATRAEAAEPMRVFIMPGEDDETALVPEPLYRALARAGIDSAAGVRILTSRVIVPTSPPETGNPERWRVVLELDAAAPGVLSLGPAGAAPGWVVESLLVDGRRVAPADGPWRNEVTVPTTGRHTVEVDLLPRVEAAGDVEMLAVSLPPAPAAVLACEDRASARDRGLRCEAAAPGGPFVAVAETTSGPAGRPAYDLAGAERVRIIRSRVPGISLADALPLVESRNTVSWDLDACRVSARFVVDPGRAIAAPCIVRADDGLQLVEPVDATLDVTPLPGNRWAVRAVAPTGGPWRFELGFRMPLADPVGRFHVPGAWIDGSSADTRTIRFAAAADLAVQVEAPTPFVPVPADDAAWRLEVRPPAAATGAAGADRIRIAVERRRQEVRGTQDVQVRFTAERTVVSLDARFDAASAPLVALPVEMPAECVIDSIVLLDDGLHAAEATDRGPIEAQWRRHAPDRGTLTVQRPRAGRFQLELMAHLPRPPAPTGRVPVVRVAMPAAPLVASWNESLTGEAPRRSWQLRSDERPPLYTLRQAAAAEEVTTVPVEPQAVPEPRVSEEPRVELADVEVSFESRGRAWGRARFDVVARQRLLRIALPGGMRLFDVLVDGQPTATVTPAVAAGPGGDAVGERWDVRLHDASWPRSIEVVYAGSVGDAADDGPVAIAAPMIVGLPCMRRLWTLRAPRDAVIHVAGPGRVATPAEVREERAAALGAIGAAFDASIATAAPPDRERLREEFASRQRRLEEAGQPSAPRGEVVPVIGTGADATLTIRIARRRDPTLLARAWATTAILAIGGALWIGMRRRLAG